MSVVAIPFRDEDPSVVHANIATAASHPRVDRVWAIGHSDELSPASTGAGGHGATVEIFAEERIGSFRPGKGDAMNTALQRAARDGVDRLHFYDADITNFDHGWIDGAESGADEGFEVVRHTFPRAATDAMITWFVTRPLLAMRYPGTLLPRIGQPLGGELLLTGEAVAAMAQSPSVAARSDWGIDTLLTHGTIDAGFSLFEHHVAAGKQHALYGSLAEIRAMAVECFDAAIGLPRRDPPTIEHRRDPDAAVPDEMKSVVAYSRDRTRSLLTRPLEPGEEEAVASLPGDVASAIDELRSAGDSSGFDADYWWEFLRAAAPLFDLGSAGWQALVFRAWVGRVINYTDTIAVRGYDSAMAYLEATIADYEAEASRVGTLS